MGSRRLRSGSGEFVIHLCDGLLRHGKAVRFQNGAEPASVGVRVPASVVSLEVQSLNGVRGKAKANQANTHTRERVGFRRESLAPLQAARLQRGLRYSRLCLQRKVLSSSERLDLPSRLGACAVTGQNAAPSASLRVGRTGSCTCQAKTEKNKGEGGRQRKNKQVG